MGLSLLLAVMLAYLPGIQNGSFHFDDVHHITGNDALRDPSNLWRLRYFADATLWSGEPGNVMYRPVGMLPHALDFVVWRALAMNGYYASGWLLTNALLHALVAILTWRLAARIGLSDTAAALAGFVTALHPVHTEVVNYVSARSESVAAVFVLLALLAHLRAGDREGGSRWGWLVVAGVLSGLSLMAKETAALFFVAVAWMELVIPRAGRVPIAFLGEILGEVLRGCGDILEAVGLRSVRRAIDWLADGDRLWRALVIAAWYAAFFGLVMLARKLALDYAVPGLRVVTPVENADVQVGGGRTVVQNLLTQSRVVVLYYQLLLRPVGLNVDHDVAVVTRVTPAVAVSLALHASIAIAAVRELLRGRRLVPLCVGWFWLFLAPSVIVPLNVIMNEHRLYLPGIAVALLAGAALERAGSAIARRRGRTAGVAAIAVPFLLFVPLVVTRSLEWRDDVTLWEVAVRRSPKSARAHMHLGAAWHERANRAPPDEGLPLLERALAEYEIADRLHPRWFDLQLNIGGAWLAHGRATGSREEVERALATYELAGEIVGPEKPRTRLLRAATLATLERYDEAVEIIRALDAEDDAVTTIYDDALAPALRGKGDNEGAAEAMERVIALQVPGDNIDGLLTLGWWYFEDGDLARSEPYLTRALEIAREVGERDRGEAARKALYRAHLYVARFLYLVGTPDPEFERGAAKLGWAAKPHDVEWVRGGRTPGIAPELR